MCRTSAVIFCTLYLIGLFGSNHAAVTAEQKSKIHEKLEGIGLLCVKDNAITEDDITSLRARKVPSGPNAPCFLACMMKEIGVMDSDGKIQKESALEIAKTIFEDSEDLKNVEDYLHSCAHINTEEVSDGDKGCDRAMSAYKCMTENSSKFGFDSV
ncbi:hypothetical protein K1T71_008345 [Dendrolimus kikuchii]|uniref:Uncharacterized protein n=1 Tax=Dendrolimus kikuchii TaxID=765133 RepID=A0ACC1CX57_9NEOP|nr:hypothetical protein K1T71_008345 [Dendrolimus kikuchii]